MSIISEALRKAGDERRDNVVVLKDFPKRGSGPVVKRRAARGTRMSWTLPAAIAAFFVIGAGIAAIATLGVRSQHSTNARAVPGAPAVTEVAEVEAVIKEERPIKRPTAVALDEPAREVPIVEVAAIDKDVQAAVSQALATSEEPPASLIFSLTLNGVMEGATEDSMAIINDTILKKGDFIQGAQVVNIASDNVTLLYKGKEIVLRID